MTKDIQVSILKACGRYVRKQMAERDEAIKALQKRLDDTPKYRGLFNRADVYERGDCVTHSGSAFFCLKDGTTSPPTHDDDKISPEWQLFVRRGRDAARRSE